MASFWGFGMCDLDARRFCGEYDAVIGMKLYIFGKLNEPFHPSRCIFKILHTIYKKCTFLFSFFTLINIGAYTYMPTRKSFLKR